MIKILTPTSSYVTAYEEAVNFSTQQMAIFWPAEELGVEEDEQHFRVLMTPAQKSAVRVMQSIITQYELIIGGEEYWGGSISKMFPRPEIQRMCSVFSMVELNSHAPFYDLANKTIGIATDEFYTSWQEDEVLASRISKLREYAESSNPLLLSGALCVIEGVILFSTLGAFKSFNANGNNLIPHFVSGIDGSVKDENLHSLASAWLYNQTKKELIEAGEYVSVDAELSSIIEDAYQHELIIIDKIFADGDILVVSKNDLIEFVEDRVNVVSSRLGLPVKFYRPACVVSGWLYKQLNSYKHADFFVGTQLQYTINWNKNKISFMVD